jgi:hypothetical protein
MQCYNPENCDLKSAEYYCNYFLFIYLWSSHSYCDESHYLVILQDPVFIASHVFYARFYLAKEI